VHVSEPGAPGFGQKPVQDVTQANPTPAQPQATVGFGSLASGASAAKPATTSLHKSDSKPAGLNGLQQSGNEYLPLM